MAPTAPSPLTWTLRLKHHKSTTLLNVDPLQSFDSIKKELLRALHQTHPEGQLPNGIQIPSEHADVIFGQPNDVHDLSRGWKRIVSEWDALEEDPLPAAGAAGKATGTKKQKGRSALPEDCPTAAGLKDGGVLAYRFRSEDEPESDEALGLGEEEEDWDVVIPDYEDTGEPKVGAGER